MKIVKMNSRMRNLYRPDWDLGSITIAEELQKIIESGIVVHEGCFVFKDILEANPHIPVNSLQSRTAYEDFINHLHMRYFSVSDQDLLPVGFAFMQKTSDILRKQFPDETFYGTIGTDLNVHDCVVRFHCLHEGEEDLVVDNLDEFKTEAVCLIEL